MLGNTTFKIYCDNIYFIHAYTVFDGFHIQCEKLSIKITRSTCTNLTIRGLVISQTDSINAIIHTVHSIWRIIVLAYTSYNCF